MTTRISVGEAESSKNCVVEHESQRSATTTLRNRDNMERHDGVDASVDTQPTVVSDWQEPGEGLLKGFLSRIFQLLARSAPGAMTLRVMLHRARGVKIGKGVWIGYDVVLDTARPDLITIEDGASISMRATIIAHFKEFRGVKIGREAFIGPGATILPNVVIGPGAVVTAGSVVSQSIPAMTVVQGNPAVPVARCGIPFRQDISMKAFSRRLRPLDR
jgi:acetyltransferase-like isoleucine patch superfamily enzyme